MAKPYAAQMADEIKLVKVTATQDSIGQTVRAETLRTVYCDVSSVGASEFFEAGRNGLNAQLQARVYDFEYDGEETVEYGGKRYGVYRTYRTQHGLIELYLERKTGA